MLVRPSSPRDPTRRSSTLERLLGVLAAVDARRAEEHDGVLDVLRLEAAQRLEILGEDPERARFFGFEKLGIEIRERLRMHGADYFRFSDL